MSTVTWEAARGNATLLVLTLLSVLSLAIALERLVTTLLCRRRLTRSQAHLAGELRARGAAPARAALFEGPPHPAASPLGLLLEAPAQEATGRRALLALGRVHRQAGRRLWVLASIGAMAPFIGLFGTVLGVMDAFAAIGESGAGGFEVVSKGLSEALVTTAAGILVAIEAIGLFNFLKVLVGDYTYELREGFEQVRALAQGAGGGGGVGG